MRIRSILAAFALTAVMACGGGGGKKEDTMVVGGAGGGGGGDTAAPAESLYTRLGGKESIAKVVDMFVANVAADVRINAFFANTDIARLKGHLVDQICEAASAGTECKYTGKSMKEVHLDMGVKQEHFDALVEDLVKALDAAGVGQREKDELLGALAPMAADIVEN